MDSIHFYSSSVVEQPPVAKRRRLHDVPNSERSRRSSTEAHLSRYTNVGDLDDDDGMQCNICLEIWQSTGEQRLVELKCGHLFLHWIKSTHTDGEGRRNQHSCPQCKQPTAPNDVIPIYDKRVRVLDNSTAVQLGDSLGEEVKKLQAKLNLMSSKLAKIKKLFSKISNN